ncbi:hypothetical protein FHL15_009159 [Xylaria flabelliformis]|uniref:Clr5 domain-containing protein n=1 Tax=Xylaria flabelliformis TaxID=2512241 RepID=A0A553HPL4_9PEZI|nr:hypothetical protein FHL15_009159 [Xylaria flabelliformis]
MPISQTTTRILRSEWEDRKSRLIELYLDLNLPLLGPNGVIETMANEGFAATKPQYEYQFRVWKVRKNMKRLEYERIIRERQHGVEPSTITLEGRAISNARFERALRRYASGATQAQKLVLGNTIGTVRAPSMSIEDRNTLVEDLVSKAPALTTRSDDRVGGRAIDGESSPKNPDHNWLLTEPNETINMPSFENFGTFDTYMGIDDLINTVDFNLPEIPTDDSLLNLIPERAMDVVGIQQNQPLSPQLVGGRFNTTEPIGNFMAVPSEGSPNTRWQGRILQRHQWIPPSAVITTTIIKGIYDAAPTTSARDVMSNFCNLASDFSESISKKHLPANFPLVLRNLVSTEIFMGENFTEPPRNVTSHVVTEARLYPRLIRSIINGFAGLQSIPEDGVLKFLNKHHTTSLSMILFLGSNSNPATKSLTQNIFIAALAQDNVNIVSYLLSYSKLVHVNNTVCHYHGERFTPLEMAIVNQSYGVVELLLEQNVDVNKSLSQKNSFNENSRALELLLRYSDQYSGTDDKILGLVDQFLVAGAKVSVGVLRMQIGKPGRQVDQRLVTRLIDKIASQAPEELVFDDWFLGSIVKEFRKSDAGRMIEHIIERCQKAGASWCSYRYLLRVAMSRGDHGLVEFLVPYVSPSEVLQIARRTGSRDIIDSLFSKCPANNNVNEKPDSIKTVVAAVQGNLLTVLEDRDLRHLKCRELGQAFTAALEKGNLQFAVRVLDFDPDFRFAEDLDFDIEAAIRAALAHDYDDIAWELTALTIAHERRSTLLEAVRQRRPDLVRAILESGIRLVQEFDPFDQFANEAHYILIAAVEWGDKSIIQDLWQTRLGAIYPLRKLMKRAIKEGQMDLFWDIFEAWSIQKPNHGWPGAINIAIECKDLCLLDELISRGARLDDDKALEAALHCNVSMAKSLLSRYRQAYPKGCVGYGRRLVKKAFRQGLSEWIDLFLEFDLIRGDNLRGGNDGEDPLVLVLRCVKRCQSFGEKCPWGSLIQRLLDTGSDANSTFNTSSSSSRGNDSTTFLLAIETRKVDVVELLIERGAEVNKPARFGIKHTPLQKAAELNDVEIANLLLENGAEVNALPAIFGGATALQFAAIHGNCDLAMKLIEHGARLDAPPSKGPHGRWPLEGAAENGRLDMIQLLWDVNNGPFDDKQCQKAMRLAEYYGHLGCKDLIMELMAKSSRGPW